MQIWRIFSADKYKGTQNYIDSQKKFEILRTALYFGVSISLFVSGLLLVKSRVNLLTLVAVLGCLPASKSAVEMIMFLRFKSCSSQAAQEIEHHIGSLKGCYDLVFTAYDKNYPVAHMTVKGNTLCGYTEAGNFDEQAFAKHLDGLLRADQFKDTTIKIFRDLKKYTVRLDQLQSVEADETRTAGILSTLKSVSL